MNFDHIINICSASWEWKNYCIRAWNSSFNIHTIPIHPLVSTPNAWPCGKRIQNTYKHKTFRQSRKVFKVQLFLYQFLVAWRRQNVFISFQNYTYFMNSSKFNSTLSPYNAINLVYSNNFISYMYILISLCVLAIIYQKGSLIIGLRPLKPSNHAVD